MHDPNIIPLNLNIRVREDEVKGGEAIPQDEILRVRQIALDEAIAELLQQLMDEPFEEDEEPEFVLHQVIVNNVVMPANDNINNMDFDL